MLPWGNRPALHGALLLCLLLAGCGTATTVGVATVLGTGAGVGADIVVQHWLNDSVGRSFAAPPEDVHDAALKALRYMAIPVTADTVTATGWRITGAAARRRIVVTLEALSAAATAMQVTVHRRGGLFADRATADEIARQTAIGLGAAATAL